MGLGLRIRAGELRQCVDLQYFSEVADAHNQLVKNWITVATDVRAGIMPLRGAEILKADTTRTRITHRIIMRYINGLTSDLDSTYRLVFGTRIFNIDSAINVQERNHKWEIMAIESKDRISVNDLILEDGFNILTEDGSNILLEG